MTVNEAIMAADKLRPNTYSEDEKTLWLSELDGKIRLEIFNNNESVKAYTYPGDADTALVIKAPHDEMYPLYIIAMIDFYNRDEDYVNSFGLFNAKYDLFAKWYIRNNMPPQRGVFKGFF